MLIGIMSWIRIMDYYNNDRNKDKPFLKCCVDLNIVNTQVSKVAHKLEDLGWVIIVKKGRNKTITFTPKGKEIAESCLILLNSVGREYGIKKLDRRS